MSKFKLELLLCIVFLSLISTKVCAETQYQLENFALLDHNGAYHELFEYKDKKAIVIYSHGVACPIVRHNVNALHDLQKKYQNTVQFLMINGNIQDELEDIQEEASTFNIKIPILHDPSQNVISLLQFQRTAQAIVILPHNWKIVYRGPVDDRLDYETQKSIAKNHFLRDALDTVLTNKTPQKQNRETKGCAITYHKDPAISFTKEIVPILKQRCIICHRKDGLAPWSMSSHKKIHGWSKMIREVVLTKRMPPWPADPTIGKFKFSNYLLPKEQRKLLKWIEQGCALDGEDKLKELVSVSRPKEEPDMVIPIPPQEIPATGVIPYRFANASIQLEKDVWVKKAEIIPGNKKVVHHVIGSIIFPKHFRSLRSKVDNAGFFASYIPGLTAEDFPNNSGVFLPKGTTFRFQIHYTPYGRKVVDRSQLHLYFHTTKPSSHVYIHLLHNKKFNIPPHTQNYKTQAQYTFREEVTLYSFLPHMHYRGRNVNLELQFPNGKKQQVLSVPKYEFNWQYFYHFQQPLSLPAGTIIRMKGSFDNSTRNKYDIDPSKTVKWGAQSWDEMFLGQFIYLKKNPGKYSFKMSKKRLAFYGIVISIILCIVIFFVKRYKFS
ncbi:redoxin domain-containing protein [Candidatus Uabimicrobium amorphum]|nr:redoxin domain-containing protein [Candidatus Uabimicrobium amorphum]